MSLTRNAAVFAFSTMIISPASAFTGTGGCSSLPEYYRALGAMQGGMQSACDMSVDEARRILQAYDGGSATQSVTPPRKGYRRYRTQMPQR